MSELCTSIAIATAVVCQKYVCCFTGVIVGLTLKLFTLILGCYLELLLFLCAPCWTIVVLYGRLL